MTRIWKPVMDCTFKDIKEFNDKVTKHWKPSYPTSIILLVPCKEYECDCGENHNQFEVQLVREKAGAPIMIKWDGELIKFDESKPIIGESLWNYINDWLYKAAKEK